jgi:hypothetical protein
LSAYIVTMLNQLPLTLPSWMPPWAALIIAIVVVLYGLLFLIMPFSVFGVKGRIDALEAQIETLHDEVRMLAMRAAGIIPAQHPLDPLPRTVRDEPRPPPRGEPPTLQDRAAAPRAELPEFERLKNAQRAAAPAPAPAPGPAPAPMFPPARPARPSAPPSPRGRAEPRLD